jgi:hypothetical protein
VSSHQIVDVSQVEARNGIFRALTDQLGVAGFRVNQLELAAGAEGLEHDHLGNDQEEVYAVGPCSRTHPTPFGGAGALVAAVIGACALLAGDRIPDKPLAATESKALPGNLVPDTA